MAVPTHPGLTPAEFAAPMERAGWWKAPMELIDVEVVVIPPTGGGASLAQTEIVRRIGGWQTDRGAGGRLLTDVFARVGDAIVAQMWRGGPRAANPRSAGERSRSSTS